MAYVITESCTKDALCVDACPVDCIHPKTDEANFDSTETLFINPGECIDCGACVPVCPASAIYQVDEVPAEMSAAIEKNAAFYN
jgi:NAD-dependent dihydropyrimidine dehydrogenase PreA subunit